MCTFLTAAVPPAREAAVVQALREAGLEVKHQTNPAVAALFAPGRALLLVTHVRASSSLRASATRPRSSRSVG